MNALEPIRAEIVRHHEVIRRWLAGTMPRSDFGAFADAHAPGFTMVRPDGSALDRDRVLEWVREAYGTVPGIVIEISDVALVAEEGALAVASYAERRSTGPAIRSTVVFRRGSGLAWLHLHETIVS